MKTTCVHEVYFMKITVVTVCFNEERNIAKTVESVLSQTSSDFEYIICDGGSGDKTVEIARSYEDAFAKKGVKFTVNSERDKGIYDGMNKGIELASGDYVYFLNAGDWFYSDTVLAEIIEKMGDKAPEVVYGDCLCVDRGVAKIFVSDHTHLSEYMSIAHPATLVRADVIKENVFDISYKIAADYNMMLTLYSKGCEFFKIDVTVSKFSADGVSSIRIVRTAEETCDVRERNGIAFDRNAVMCAARKQELRMKIKRKIPRIIRNFWHKHIKKSQWIGE